MMRIAALNDESSDESEEEDVPTVTKEAQEELSLSRYKESLEMIRDGRNKEAEDILLELLGTKLLQEVEKTTGAMQVPASLSLKYSCLKNIGMLALKRDDDSAALDYFLRAVQLDDTDGLRCSPSHWPCLDHLVTILFALDDYMTCLLYVSRGLRRDSQFTKGLVLRDEMLRETPFLKDIYKDMHIRDPLPMDGTPDTDVAKEILQEAVEIRKRWFEAGKAKPLEALGLSTTLEFTWQALGEELLNLYQFAQETDEPFTICNPVNLNVVRPKSTTTSPQGKAQTEKHDQNTAEGDNEAGKGKNGGRRRMFLESWVLGGQRRSARVRSTVRRDNEDTSLGETLRRIIPLSLFSKEGIRSSEDSMDTMDMFKLFERQEGDPASITTRRTSNNSQADVDEAIKREEYFGTDKETEDVKKFVADNQVNCGVSLLIVAYTQCLSAKQSLTWPTKLIPVFLDCYELMRKCAPHTNPFCDEFEPEEYKSDGEITLHSCEMFVDRQPPRKRNTADSNENTIPLRIVEDVTHLIFLSGRKHLFKNDFELRVYWLRSHVAIQKNDPQDALYCLNQVLDCLVEFPEGAVIPNLRNNGLVTVEVVEKLQSTLENTRSLAGIEQLWEEQRWEELATILESSFQSQQVSSEQQRTMEDLCRTTQIEMFLDALVRLENQFPRCFFWIEACLNEAFNKYLSMTDDEELQRKWAKVIEKLLTGFIYCIEENDIKIIGTLPSQRLSRMVQNLSHIICHQLETLESVIEMPIETVDPWILLQLILTYEEEKRRAHEDAASNASSEDSHKPSEIPGSLMILFTAHEHLGKRSWCCLNEGALLLHSMEEIIPKLRSEAFAPFRSKLTPYVEQIIYCLYAYPNKKTKGRHLQEHSVPQLPLTFDRAQQLLEFYRPDELPEFDSYRLGSISADAEVLFKRILTLAPPESNPGNFIDEMKDYIFDLSPDLPKAKHTPLPPGVRDINYLLGDYYFKNSDLQKAIQYYLLDVCHNPDRLDSWAGMALARGSQLETQLNSCEAIDEVEYLKQASAAQRCYKRTLELDNFHGLIWIEFGSFVYMIHSFCSRLLKQESDRLSLEQFEMLEEKKEATLNTAEECFKKASQLWQDLGEESAQQDERWLHHYMLGKIVEKREDDPIEAITQYQKAAKFLFENNATYPSKISYTNPPEYSIEALEIHYRIHACILKFLESNEGKQIDEKNEKFFAKVIEIEKNGQFAIGQSKADMQIPRKRKSSTESSNDSKRIHLDTSSSNDVKNVVENMVVQVDKDNITGNLMQGDEIQFPARVMEHKGKGNGRSSVETDKSAPKSPRRRGSQESTTTITSTTTTTTESSSSSSDSSSSSSSSSSSDSSDSSDTENDGKTTKPPEAAKQPEEVKTKPKVPETKIDLKNLVQACLKALETCVIRFPEHYKALFRLAHYHFRSRAHRDVARCRDLLLGPDVPASSALHGLFQDRKPSNFFNGVWRIPINEIDRPGCFASHMSRCVLLTMDLVRELKDHNTLLDLCLQLRRIPEPDKKYLRDTEREQLSRQAVVLALQVLRSRFKELKPGDEKFPPLMVEVLRSLQKVQKQLPNREQAFSKLLTDCFAMYKFGKQESDRLSLEQFEMLEEKKEATLNTAEECFKKASQLWQDLGEESAQQDERWLHHYMLGKIVEKREDDPIEAITQYQKAAKFLFENNATYPSKISYTNPPEYSIEALEIHYRIHACILKFLESNEGKQIDEKNEKFFAKVIEIEKNGQFAIGQSKADMQIPRKRKSSTESSNDSKRIHLDTSSSNDVKNVVENMVVQVDKDNITGNLMQGDEIQFPARVMEHKGKGNGRSSVETDKSAPKSPRRRGSQESTTTITSTTTTTTESSSSSSDSSSSSSSSSSSDSSDSSDTENDGKTTKPPEAAKQPEEVKTKPKVPETKIDLKNLVQACLKALETCVIRFPEHYKALFRLAHYHFRSRAHRDVARCRDLLLGPDVPASSALHGLFQDRKPSNFFNGVWRIPINEIDRPGCFASHMSRCVLLTMDLVRELKDHNTLLDLCLQLRRIPEPDKKYLRDTEREQLSRQAVVLALQVLRSRFKELKPGDEKFPPLMVEVLRSLQKVQKQLPNREQAFSKLLTDCFAMYKFGKVDTDVNLTDPALKFAQAELARIKAQQAQAMANVTLPAQSLASPSTVTAPTSLPTPPVSSVPARKEKSSGTSRRGRPPLSRTTVPRMSNPMNFSPNLSTVGSSGRGRPRGRSSAQPFSYMPNLLSDPSYLTAAMQSSVPSLDVAMTYLNFKAQMEAQFMQQMLGNTAANFPNFNPTSLPSFPQLPSMSPYTSTAQQIAKDRPNLSVTAINPTPSTSSKPGPKPGSKKTPKEVPRQPRPQFPVKLSVPTKAKLKAKVPTPPMRASPVPRPSNSPIPSQARRPSPVPTKRHSPIPSQVRRNSPIPPKRNSPVPQMQRSSPLPAVVKSSTVQQSSPILGGSRQSPIPPAVRKQSPIPPIARRQSPIPPIARRQSPIPPIARRQSPIPSMARRQSPIPPVARRQSPIPPAVRRQSPIPPSGPPTNKKSSPISPVRHIANPAPSTMTSSMIPRGPPGLSHRPQQSYISPPQAHMNPTLERIGREVTVTASVSKHPRVEAPKPMTLPLNLPSSITITPKSHHRATAPPGRDEISIQQLPPATITRAEPKVSPPKPDKPKTGPGVEIITLE
ncbi:hypothetical protein B566_EDAN015309 [Ephemera danica]|nr:hypothetical protein B566_EDAN015309 [Ephemera danica]